MSETLRFFTIQVTLLAVVLALHTYLGLHIIRRVIVFSDLALDQIAALGALIGIGIGIEYGTIPSYLISLVAVLAGSLLLSVIKPKKELIPREAVIGIVFALALVASLLLGDKLAGGSAYVTKTLSGSMLWVTWKLVIVTLVVYLALMAFHFKFREQFISLSKNDKFARSSKRWDFLFFASLGIVTVLIVPVAGVLLAYAFMMIPAAIATMFTKEWKRGIVFGWSVGLLACICGLICSYSFNLPYGPSLVLALGSFFVGAMILRISIAQKV